MASRYDQSATTYWRNRRSTVDDRIRAGIDLYHAQRATGSIYLAADNDALEQARINRLARQTGMPPEVVAADPQHFERTRRTEAALANARTSPEYARMMSDQRFAAAAIDDESIHPLAIAVQQTQRFAMEASRLALASRGAGFAYPVPNWGDAPPSPLTRGSARMRARSWSNDPDIVNRNWFVRMGAAIDRRASRLVSGIATGLAVGADTLGWEGGEEFFEGRSRRLRELADGPESTPTDWEDVKANPLQAPVYGIEQFIASTPDIAGVIYALPAYIFARSGEIAQDRAQNNGQDEVTIENLVTAAPFATASALLERFGIRGVGTAIANPAVRTTVMAATREASTETIQSALEYTGATANTEAGFDLNQAADQILAGAVGGFFGGGVAAGAGASVNAAVRYVAEHRNGQAAAQNIDAVMRQAASSPTRTASPSEFEQALSGILADRPGENLFIPAERVLELFQSEDASTPAPRLQDDPFWSGHAEQLRAAAAVGGDVIIPLASAATHLAGTPQWQRLYEHVRASPGGMSLAEAKDSKKAVAKLEEAAEAMASEIEEKIPLFRLHQELHGFAAKLGLAGPEASAAARLTAARLMAATELENVKRAARGEAPITPRQLWQRWNLSARKVSQAEYEAERGAGAAPVVLAQDELPRAAATIEEARVLAQPLVGRALRNESTGLEATISRATLKKMTSGSAVAKSTSVADHLLALANVDALYGAAALRETKPDERGEQTIVAIHRFVAPLRTTDGRTVDVMMTVKETRSPKQPNPLYTIETVEVGPGSVAEPSAPGQNRNAAPPDPADDVDETGADLNQSLLQAADVSRREFLGGAVAAAAGGFTLGGKLYAQPPGVVAVLERSFSEPVPLTEALEAVVASSANADFKRFAGRMLPLVRNIVIRSANVGDTKAGAPEDIALGLAHGMHQVDETTDGDVIWLARGDLVDGLNENTLMHEALHAALYRVFGRLTVRMAENDPSRLREAGFNREAVARPESEPHLQELLSLYRDAVTAYEAMMQTLPLGEEQSDRVRHIRNAIGNPDEFLSWALENPNVQAFLREQQSTASSAGQERGGEPSLWDRFVELVRRALGLESQEGEGRTALDDVLDATYRLLADPAGPSSETNFLGNGDVAEIGRGENGRLQRSLLSAGAAPPFYSALERAVEASPMERATAEQWSALLTPGRTPGVKAEEVEWTGILDWLKMQDGSIERSALLNVLQERGITVEEVVLGGKPSLIPDAEIDAIADGRFEEAVVREIERLEDRGFEPDVEAIRGSINYGRIRDDVESELERESASDPQYPSHTSDPDNPTYRELLITLPLGVRNNPETAPVTHWDTDAVVAHVRFMQKTDTEGRRILFVEEVQSDWHQKGRDQGYAVAATAEEQEAAERGYGEALRAWNADGAALVKLAERLGVMPATDSSGRQWTQMPPVESYRVAEHLLARVHADAATAPSHLLAIKRARQDYSDTALRMREAYQALENSRGRGGVPEAPFKASWPALVMKRVIRWAVDNGIDRIAWTTGEEQAERYNLSHAVGQIAASQRKDGRYDLQMNDRAAAALKEQGLAVGEGGQTAIMTAEQMKQAFGGDVAARIISGTRERADAGYKAPLILQGDDLRVGGEGMRAFYDRNLVNITNDIVKKYGVKVGRVRIPSRADYGTPYFSAEANLAAAERSKQVVDGLGGVRGVRAKIKKLRENDDAVEVAGALHDATSLSAILEISDFRRVDEFRAALDAIPAPTNPGFTITPELAAAASSGLPLFQKKRGNIQIGRDEYGLPTGAVITAFEAANFSTFVHEMGHFWLEDLRARAIADDATEQERADWLAVKGWAKDRAGTDFADDAAIPVEAHELWARGMEVYVFEGKAPSKALRALFSQMREWMVRLYRSVLSLNAPITPEIRLVMDRLFASEAEIAQQQQDLALVGKTLGDVMTGQELAEYQRLGEEVRADARDRLFERVLSAVRGQRRRAYGAAKRQLEREVEDRVDELPIFRALKALRVGLDQGDGTVRPVRLSRGWLVEQYGEEVLARLPNPRGILPIYGDADTLNADVLAEMVGFGSGDELVQGLLFMEEERTSAKAAGDKRSMRQRMIEEEVDQRLRDDIGDPFENLEEEAQAALASERQADLMSMELRAIARKTGQKVTPWQMAREWAAGRIAASTAREALSGASLAMYARNIAKAGAATEEALARQDFPEAVNRKQQQLLSLALLSEARAAKDSVEIAVRRLQRTARRKGGKTIDPAYLDVAHDLLEATDLKARSAPDVQRRLTFEAWYGEQIAMGRQPVVPPEYARTLGQTNWQEMKVADLLELDDLVSQVMTLGRTKQKIHDAEERRDFEEFKAEVRESIAQLPARKLPESPAMSDRRLGAEAMAPLIKVEAIADDLDNHNPNGPMNRLLIRRATDAANYRDELRDRVLRPISDLYLKMGAKQRRRLSSKVTIPELTWNTVADNDPRKGQVVTLTRMQLLAVLMNMGNRSNLEKLTAGERWPESTLWAVMQREISKEDAELAQKLWDQVGSLWPQIVETELAVNGIAPEKVDAVPIVLPHGTYSGGYWPIRYDTARSKRAELYDEVADTLFGIGSIVATPKGHTKERTNAVGPFSYALEEVLFEHVERVITRIAYAEWVGDVLRTVDDPDISGEVDVKLGPEYRAQIRPWLKRQVTQYIDHRGAKFWDEVMRQSRIHLNIAAMGLKWSTGIAQTAGLATASGRIGPRWVAHGLRRTFGERGAVAFALGKSAELRHRNAAMTREMIEVQRRLKARSGPKAQAAELYRKLQSAAFWHIGIVDRYLVSVPSWLGAYDKALSQGMTDEEAVHFADKGVRMSQGAGREKDLSAFQSPNNEALKFLSMFYGPFNVQLNNQWEAARLAKRGNYVRALTLSFYFLVAQTLVSALISGDTPQDDEDDGIGNDLVPWATRNIFFGLFAGVPVVREFAGQANRKISGRYGEFGETPLSRGMDTTWKAARETWELAAPAAADNLDFLLPPEWVQWLEDQEGEPPRRPAEFMADTLALLGGLPVSQIGDTVQFLWDYQEGEAEPEGIGDWYEGLTRGRVEQD